jgi:hypothetical protein
MDRKEEENDDLQSKAKQLDEFYFAYKKELLLLNDRAEKLIKKRRGADAFESSHGGI